MTIPQAIRTREWTVGDLTSLQVGKWFAPLHTEELTTLLAARSTGELTTPVLDGQAGWMLTDHTITLKCLDCPGIHNIAFTL